MALSSTTTDQLHLGDVLGYFSRSQSPPAPVTSMSRLRPPAPPLLSPPVQLLATSVATHACSGSGCDPLVPGCGRCRCSTSAPPVVMGVIARPAMRERLSSSVMGHLQRAGGSGGRGELSGICGRSRGSAGGPEVANVGDRRGECTLGTGDRSDPLTCLYVPAGGRSCLETGALRGARVAFYRALQRGCPIESTTGPTARGEGLQGPPGG